MAHRARYLRAFPVPIPALCREIGNGNGVRGGGFDRNCRGGEAVAPGSIGDLLKAARP